jgi:hypothetical protein
MTKIKNEKNALIATSAKHTCGSNVSIPHPKNAEFISGTYTVFVKCFCPTCNSDVLLRLDQYDNAYRAATKPRTMGGSA